MSTQIDWQDEIDGAIPPAPDRPVELYVAAGRTAVRRRRAATALAGLATAVVVGGVAWAAAPGPGAPRTDPSVATQPGHKAESGEDPIAAQTIAPMATRPSDVREGTPAEAELFENTMPVSVTDGGLVHRPGWEVEVLHALRDRPRERVWGISARRASGGDALWMLITWRPGSVGALSDSEGKRFSAFEDWLDATWAEQRGLEVPRVAWTVGGQLAVDDDVEVLETVDHPRQAAAYGPVEEQVAAKVRLADGSVVFVLAGPEGATTVDPTVLASPTMDAFLQHLAQQADNGEGLR